MTTPSSDGVRARRSKSRIVSFRVTEDDFAQLDALAHKTSCSRGEVLRWCLRGARLKSTVDAQALTAITLPKLSLWAKREHSGITGHLLRFRQRRSDLSAPILQKKYCIISWTFNIWRVSSSPAQRRQ